MSGRLIDCEKLKKFLWEKSEDHRNTPEMSYGSSPCDLAMANAYESVIDEITSGRLDAQSPTPGQDGLKWLPMETAPKGGGAELRTDPKWVDPPCILLLFGEGQISVGYWDWYYAEGGNGYNGGHAWIEPLSGERLDLHYDAPIGWKPLHPPPPQPEKENE